MKSFFLTAGVVSVFAIHLPLPASAQEASILEQTVDATCSAFLAPILGRKDIAQLAVDRPIDSRVVCSCAKSGTKADPRLTDYLSMDGAAIERKAEDPKIRAYILGRILHSVLACFNSEFESTLAAAKVAR